MLVPLSVEIYELTHFYYLQNIYMSHNIMFLRVAINHCGTKQEIGSFELGCFIIEFNYNTYLHKLNYV